MGLSGDVMNSPVEWIGTNELHPHFVVMLWNPHVKKLVKNIMGMVTHKIVGQIGKSDPKY